MPAEPLARDALERVDDADHRAEQSDERRRRADGRERRDALLEVRRGQRRGALNRAAHGVHQVFARQAAAALLLELIFLQPGEHDLGEVAVAVVLRGRQRDRVLQASFLQVLGDLRRVELRLVARLREGEDALDRDAERPHRHDRRGRTPPPSPRIPSDCHICIKSTVHPPSSVVSKFEVANDVEVVYCKVKFTVTVMMTGTGTPFSNVGVNCH